MAKSSKSARTERQKVVEQMRAEQKAAERRRGTIIVVACVLVAVGIVAAAAIGPIMDSIRTSKYSGKPLTGIGAPASVCQKVTTKPADGNQQHLADGVADPLQRLPTGVRQALPHARRRWHGSSTPPRTVPRSARSCTTRSTATRSSGTTTPSAKDSKQIDQIKAIADKFAGTTDLRDKFKAVPWTSSDGGAVPRRPARRVHALVGRRHPERRRGLRQAGRRLAVLLERLAVRRCRPSWTTTRSATPPSPAGCSRSRRATSGQVGAAGLPEPVHDRLDLLRTRAGRDQQRRRGCRRPRRRRGRPRPPGGRCRAPRAPSPSSARTRSASPSTLTSPAASPSTSDSERKSPMSSQANSPGTVATRPSAAAGSATAWSMAIFGRVGQTSSSRPGDAARSRSDAAKPGWRAASRSSSTLGRTTNMPAFQR